MIQVINIKHIAKVCHEVNRAYCKSIGDYSHKEWENCSVATQESALMGVDFVLKNPRATPKEQHNQWVLDKQGKGWQLGPEKDVVKKTHPCLIPFDELPQHQKSKDYIFQQIVKSVRSIQLMDSLDL